MKNKLIKKVTAAALAFALIGGAAAFPAGDKPLFDSALTVNAATSTATFDSSTGVLTLHGNVVKEDVQEWAENEEVKKVVCEEGTVFPSDCTNLFDCFYAEEFELSKVDTSNVKIMRLMFASCIHVNKLDLSSFDTGNVTDMGAMFNCCGDTLESVDLSSFDTSKVKDMSCMFQDCYKLSSLDLSNFDTSNVTTMSTMFNECSSLEKLDLTNFDTSKVENMSCMFSGCDGLTRLDLSGFDTRKVKNMSCMFSDCINLRSLNISSFDTSKVTDMDHMFSDSSNLETLNLSSFNTGEVKDMHYMFESCSELRRIFVSDKWTIKSLDNIGGDSEMFFGCLKLVGGNGTKYDSNYVDKNRAFIDTPETPGYLTAFNTPQAMVSIAGDAAVNIIFNKTNDIMSAKLSGPNGDIIITDFSQKDEDGNVRFSYPVNATQFGDKVTLTLYGDDDSDIIYQTNYSINDYIDSAEDYITDDKALALTKALDNFGKAADNYFNGSKNIIEGIGNVNADSVKDYAPTFGTDVKLSLVLDSTTALRLYTESSNVLIDGNGATAKFKGKKKYYEISNIYAQNLCDKHKVTIDGVEYEFSPMSYVYRVLNNENASDKLIDMAKATYVYAKAAEAYVGK